VGAGLRVRIRRFTENGADLLTQKVLRLVPGMLGSLHNFHTLHPFRLHSSSSLPRKAAVRLHPSNCSSYCSSQCSAVLEKTSVLWPRLTPANSPCLKGSHWVCVPQVTGLLAALRSVQTPPPGRRPCLSLMIGATNPNKGLSLLNQGSQAARACPTTPATAPS
jgi:hypothetical protein